MISLASQHRRDWIYGGVYLLLSLVLMGLYCWLRFGELAQLEVDIDREQLAVQNLKAEQQQYFDDGLGDQLSQYSDHIQAIESLLFARDEVFTGLMSEDRFEPVVMLDLVAFFEHLQELLSEQVLVNGFSLSPTGRVNFLVRSTSYAEAARQMDALRFGLTEEEQQPQLFMEVVISGITRTPLSHSAEDLPDLLQGKEASFDFSVQMDVNPDYFAVLREQEQLSLPE